MIHNSGKKAAKVISDAKVFLQACGQPVDKDSIILMLAVNVVALREGLDLLDDGLVEQPPTISS